MIIEFILVENNAIDLLCFIFWSNRRKCMNFIFCFHTCSHNIWMSSINHGRFPFFLKVQNHVFMMLILYSNVSSKFMPLEKFKLFFYFRVCMNVCSNATMALYGILYIERWCKLFVHWSFEILEICVFHISSTIHDFRHCTPWRKCIHFLKKCFKL